MSDALPWERLENESSKAFQAFCIYRDLGPDRNLNASYRTFKQSTEPVRAPGFWQDWSSEFRWVERSAAYDDYIEAERRRIRESEMRKLEERRFRFLIRNQQSLEERVEDADEMLAKAKKLPLTEVVTKKANGVVVEQTRVRGVPIAALARLLKERNETAKQAINGVERPSEKKPDGSNGGKSGTRAEFVWKRPVIEIEQE